MHTNTKPTLMGFANMLIAIILLLGEIRAEDCAHTFLSDMDTLATVNIGYRGEGEVSNNEWANKNIYNEQQGDPHTTMEMGDENVYNKFVVIHPPGSVPSSIEFGYVTYCLGNKYQQFTGVVGLAGTSHCVDYYGDDPNRNTHGFYFKFYVDNVLKLRTNNQTVLSDWQNVDIDVSGGNILKIESYPIHDAWCAHATIADPLLICSNNYDSNNNYCSNNNDDINNNYDTWITVCIVVAVILAFVIGLVITWHYCSVSKPEVVKDQLPQAIVISNHNAQNVAPTIHTNTQVVLA